MEGVVLVTTDWLPPFAVRMIIIFYLKSDELLMPERSFYCVVLWLFLLISDLNKHGCLLLFLLFCFLYV